MKISKKYIKYLYTGIKLGIAGFALVAFGLPLWYLIFWLKKNNKTIKIFPKFEVVQVVNSLDSNLPVAKEAIRISKEILTKLK